MNLAWLTDIHLNFVDDEPRRWFLEEVRARADAVAISGDIGESDDICRYLQEMEELIAKPVYFVLGNHDFYRGSIAKTRVQVAELANRSEHLNYLTAGGCEELTPETAIIGHDGWYDGRLGDFWNTQVILSDHFLVAEIARWFAGRELDRENLFETLNALGDEAARRIESSLEDAASRYRNVIAVTHVPPFREAAWYEGKTSNDDFLPYFSCEAAGEAMKRVMQSHPESNLLVLCGHTHGGGELQAADNIKVITGEARYKHPEIRRILAIE